MFMGSYDLNRFFKFRMFVVVLLGGSLYNKVRLDLNTEMLVSSYTGTQSVENTVWGIQLFIAIMDEYKNGIKRGSVLRLKGVGEMDTVNG